MLIGLVRDVFGWKKCKFYLRCLEVIIVGSVGLVVFYCY